MSSVSFGRYNPPGVFTETVPGPVLGALTGTSRGVGLVGLSVDKIKTSEALLIPTDTGTPAASTPLSSPVVDKTTVVVSDPVTGEVFKETADYTLAASGGSFTLKRAADGKIESGMSVNVAYSYTPADYYDVKRFSDTLDVEEYYGRPFDANGNLQSPLSLAARLAFQNGATYLVTVAVKHAAAIPSAVEFSEAIAKLDNESSVSILVPVTGDEAVLANTKASVVRASANAFERRAIVGLDGASTSITSDKRISVANTLKSERVALVSPSSFDYASEDITGTKKLGSQFMAAAVAGLASTLGPQLALTRKHPAGIAALSEQVPPLDRTRESSSGLMVIEQTASGTIRIRHGLTTDMTGLLTREWSIVGQQDEVAQRVRTALDNDGIIGSVIDDLTLTNVKASADAALQGLVTDGAILDYRSLRVRQVPENPDVVEVRFEWRASVPINYIMIRYAVNVTSGDFGTVEAE